MAVLGAFLIGAVIAGADRNLRESLRGRRTSQNPIRLSDHPHDRHSAVPRAFLLRPSSSGHRARSPGEDLSDCPVLSGLARRRPGSAISARSKIGNAAQVAPIDKLSVVLVAVLCIHIASAKRPSTQGWLGIALIAWSSSTPCRAAATSVLVEHPPHTSYPGIQRRSLASGQLAPKGDLPRRSHAGVVLRTIFAID